MFWVRRGLIAFGCFVAAGLCIGLVGGFVPQVLGPATNAVLAVVLGGLIYRDIMRREPRRPGSRGAVEPPAASAAPPADG